MGRERRRDRRGRGDADRATDLLVRVDETGRDARIGLAHAGQGADGHRHEGERETDPAHEEGREQVGEVVAVDG